MSIEEKAGKYVRIEAETHINAPPEKVFAAITTGMDAWWPHRTDEKAKIVFETQPGGMIYEDHGNGSYILYGTLAGYKPPNLVVSLDISGWGEGAYNSRNIERLDSDGKGGTIYKKTLILWGDISEDLVAMFDGGVPTILEAVKQHVEN
jgi:uncharacterized protein YndB with AHSA1/START domain